MSSPSRSHTDTRKKTAPVSEGRCRDGRRDVSAFPLRRNLSMLPRGFRGALRYASGLRDHRIDLIREEPCAGDGAVLLACAAEVQPSKVGNAGIVVGAGNEAAAAICGIAEVVYRLAGVKLDRRGSHLEPPVLGTLT